MEEKVEMVHSSQDPRFQDQPSQDPPEAAQFGLRGVNGVPAQSPAAPAFNRENARAAKRPIAQGETLKKKHATRMAIQSFGPRGSHQDAQPRAEAGTKHFHAIAFLDPVRSRKITASINRATKVHAHQTAGIHGETPLAIFLVVKRSVTSLKHTAKFQHI